MPERIVPVVDESANNRRFVGVSACASCHPQQVAQWVKSNHAKAVESLKRKDGGLDALRPECLACHALGYGIPSGYQGEGRTSHLAGVQCESCHGMGSEHVATPKEKAKSTIVRGKGVAVCHNCHDKENSPQFKYEAYLQKIRHW